MIICQCLNILRNFLNLYGQVKIFEDDPSELFFKILKMSIELDERPVEEIIDLLVKLISKNKVNDLFFDRKITKMRKKDIL